MRLLGTKPPPKWPIKVFWILVAIHLPVIAIMVVTSLVEGTILAMVTFWLVAVPVYILSLLFSPLRLISAIIAVYLIWYACQFDWAALLRAISPGASDNFVRGRRLLDSDEFRSRLAARRMTFHAKPARPRPRAGLGRQQDE